jgi:hypothetical protein
METETCTLTYTQLLANTNKFMEKSGIRSFCSEVCQGGCCNFKNHKCNCAKSTCQKHTHLSCSFWLCDAMFSVLSLLSDINVKIFLQKYSIRQHEIINQIDNLAREQLTEEPPPLFVFFSDLTPGIKAGFVFKAETAIWPHNLLMEKRIKQTIEKIRTAISINPQLLEIFQGQRSIAQWQVNLLITVINMIRA